MQAPPPRPGTKKAEQPRAATIHEYLDWTVTSSAAEDEDELVHCYISIHKAENFNWASPHLLSGPRTSWCAHMCL